ncbi:MAG: SLC13 family permease [Halobacteriota archaeon]
MVAGLSTGALVVFAIVLVAVALFVTEAVSNDVTAIGVIVTLAFLEPVIGLGPAEAISGFANSATITIVAMYMLSEGVDRSGLVQRLGFELARITHGDESRILAATVATTTPIAGFVNNTPVVAVFIPMVTDLANRSHVSPSKLLLPLSYAAILGGTLTLIGTATNLIASDLTAELLDRGPIGFFEFTPLGVAVAVVGVAYLLTVGRWLTPARLEPAPDLTAEFALEDHLYLLGVRAESAIAGQHFAEIEEPPGLTIVSHQRGERTFSPGATDHGLRVGDTLVALGRFPAVDAFARANRLERLYGRPVPDTDLESPLKVGTLAKLVVPADSAYVGKTLTECRLEDRYDTVVLAIVRGQERLAAGLADVTIRPGDTLLVRSVDEALEYLHERGDVLRVDAPNYDVVAAETEGPNLLRGTAGWTLLVVAGVVLLASLDVVPIVIAALLGVVAMFVSGTLRPSQAYAAVSWNVVFLLAGVLPLGLALETTGGAAWLAAGLVDLGATAPLVLVLLLFVLVTGLLANLITPVATIVLMIPVAVDAAGQLGADPFSFLLGVTFASATSFMTPVGYQTNLMVYGPGGYRFGDFVRVGAPLQLLSALVVTAGIALWWGLSP